MCLSEKGSGLNWSTKPKASLLEAAGEGSELGSDRRGVLDWQVMVTLEEFDLPSAPGDL